MRKQVSIFIYLILILLTHPAQASPVTELKLDYAEGESSTSLSFDATNDLIMINATINGKGPFRFVVDTGASHHVMTPELAQSLGLKGKGNGVLDTGSQAKVSAELVQVAEVGLGNFKLQRQSFFVTPFPALFPFQGFLGAELFKHFVVRIDFRRTVLTLTLPRAFRYQGNGIALPIKFHEALIPQVKAEVDGHPGFFKLDTGFNGSVALFREFIDEHRLLAKYRPRKSDTGARTLTEEANGMPSAEIREFKLGPFALDGVVAFFFLDDQGSNSVFAGAIGTGVLKQFNVIIDYEKQRVLLESGDR